MKKFDARVFMASVRREAGEEWANKISAGEITHLLKLARTDFLVQAYRIFLNRDPDPAGLAAFQARSESLPGRMLILASLWLSPERIALPARLREALRMASRLLRPFGRQ
ncbi:MAG: hypothetical protein HDQ44_00910 [Desulfovibrio sp.]|nr:hypothetical protein [Desulfovibrio sp.]